MRPIIRDAGDRERRVAGVTNRERQRRAGGAQIRARESQRGGSIDQLRAHRLLHHYLRSVRCGRERNVEEILIHVIAGDVNGGAASAEGRGAENDGERGAASCCDRRTRCGDCEVTAVRAILGDADTRQVCRAHIAQGKGRRRTARAHRRRRHGHGGAAIGEIYPHRLLHSNLRLRIGPTERDVVGILVRIIRTDAQ